MIKAIIALVACWSFALLPGGESSAVSPQTGKLLRIGTSGTLITEQAGQTEQSGLESLKSFIKEETGFASEILRQKNWQELVDKLKRGELELGFFQGYEFAWAQEKHPELRPLALAVNVYPLPVGYVVAHRTNAAKGFGDLQGQSLAIPVTGQRFLQLFVERESQRHGKDLNAFFSKVTTPENVEDALDSVVDGAVQAVVVDRAGLEAYKRRKPGRFKDLKEVAHSPAFPPPLVAYYGKTLSDESLERFRNGLLGASRKDKGETLLTLFRLTGFVTAPDDFAKVVAETRKNYPASATAPK